MRRKLQIAMFCLANLSLTAFGFPPRAAAAAYPQGGRAQSAEWQNNRDRDRREAGHPGNGAYYVTPYREYGYRNGYESHRGRDAAIVAGSAAAGALIGDAAGHGQGAVIGGIIGGVTGLIVDQAAEHHHR